MRGYVSEVDISGPIYLRSREARSTRQCITSLERIKAYPAVQMSTICTASSLQRRSLLQHLNIPLLFLGAKWVVVAAVQVHEATHTVCGIFRGLD